MIGTKQIVRTGNPLVQIFLNQPRRNHPGFHNAPQTVIARAHVERFFAQHIRHRTPERSEGGIFQHLQLEFSVTVHEIGVSEEVHPVVDVDVECPQQSLVLKGAALEHFLRLDFAGIAEVVDQQRAHLPAVAHLLDHDAGDGAAIPVRGRVLQQVALLLHARKLGIALVNDHVHQRIAHLLGGNLPQVFPLAPAFVRTKLDLVGIDRAI